MLLQIGGVSAGQMNAMELDLMQRLGYRLMVPTSEINEQLAILDVLLPEPSTVDVHHVRAHKCNPSSNVSPAALSFKALEIAALE